VTFFVTTQRVGILNNGNRKSWLRRKIAKFIELPGPSRFFFWFGKPKATLLIVVVCLFVVVMNWAVQQAAWLPMPQELPSEVREIRIPVPQAPPTEETPAENVEEAPSKEARVKVERKGWDFFHPSWRETPDLNLVGSPKFHPDSWSISEQSLRRYLKDPNRKLEADFQVTPDISERVLFWMRIHTQYSSYMRVLHDRNNPGIIYGVADFTPLFRESTATDNAMARVYKYQREIEKELKARLSEAAGLTATRNLSPWERNELRSLLSRSGALGVNEAASRISSIRSQTGQRDEFLMALTRSEELLPYIEATFRSFGLPVALGRIPFVESSFNARAYSKVGATGMWQFMPFTARQMISSTRPELWSDPLLQTRAAARMLIIFHNMLPDWSTSVTAYNSGAGRLQRLTRKHHAKSIGKLTEVNDPTGLGFAGKNFYAQFMSANLVEAYRREIFPLRKKEEEDFAVAFERPRHFARRFRTVY